MSRWNPNDEVALALAHVRPTTIAGALALLRYGDDLYAQKIVLPSDPKQWHSNHENLSKFVDDDVLAAFNGKPIELPLMFWIARNARTALETIKA